MKTGVVVAAVLLTAALALGRGAVLVDRTGAVDPEPSAAPEPSVAAAAPTPTLTPTSAPAPMPAPTPTSTPTPTPAPIPPPTATATPAPTEDPTPTPPPAERFSIPVGPVEVISADNAATLSADPREPDQARGGQAVEDAVDVLAAYLDAQFVDQGTRFSEAALAGFLTSEAEALLEPGALRGLGVWDLDVGHTETGDAAVDKALVVMDGDRPLTVTLSYAASLRVTLADGTSSPVTQRGQAAMLPTEGGWRAHAVDVRIAAPDLPEEEA